MAQRHRVSVAAFAVADIPSLSGQTAIVTGANLQSHSQRRSMDFLMGNLGNRLFAQDATGGALPTLYAAVADIPGNSYAGPGGFAGMRGAPTLVNRSAAARDPAAARRLWTVSEELTGVAFPL